MFLIKDARSEWISARNKNVTKASAFEQSDSQARVSFVFLELQKSTGYVFHELSRGSRISLSSNLGSFLLILSYQLLS